MIKHEALPLKKEREEVTLQPSVPSFHPPPPRTLQTCHDDASKFVHLLAKPGCNYLEQDDFIPFLQVRPAERVEFGEGKKERDRENLCRLWAVSDLVTPQNSRFFW